MSSWIRIPLVDETEAWTREEDIRHVIDALPVDGKERCDVQTRWTTFRAATSASEMARLSAKLHRDPTVGRDGAECLAAAMRQAIKELNSYLHASQGPIPAVRILERALEAFG